MCLVNQTVYDEKTKYKGKLAGWKVVWVFHGEWLSAVFGTIYHKRGINTVNAIEVGPDIGFHVFLRRKDAEAWKDPDDARECIKPVWFERKDVIAQGLQEGVSNGRCVRVRAFTFGKRAPLHKRKTRQ